MSKRRIEINRPTFTARPGNRAGFGRQIHGRRGHDMGTETGRGEDA